MQSFSPREIVSELDRYIIGQDEAKKSVAIALRNRWRRQQLDDDMKDEVLPKNILMIGPTGIGKTEISRRLSKLAQAPFLKVEATKFTEVGYVGRDVEQIVRDLIEIAITMVREIKRKEVNAQAKLLAEERVLDCLVGPAAGSSTRDNFRKKLRNNELDEKVIEIDVQDTGSMPTIDLQGGGGGGIGMINLNDMLGKAMGSKTKKKKITVGDSYEILVNEESDKLIDSDQIISEAKKAVEENGIVFLDEIDKVCARSERVGADVSREGVQRDLLPLIEGTVVNTKHGTIKTDHILFIASGAFQLAKPSDLLPELQGRLPIRVSLKPLEKEDFKRILTEPEYSLIKQYQALLSTEDVNLEFSESGIESIASLAVHINSTIENIGARRLHTILERVLEDISFSAPDKGGEKLIIDSEYVNSHVDELSKNTDLSKFIL
ncbi:MAG: ATP-dependent protease ATPase subunit HslU [Candidatus Pelagibacterales bacterium]